MSAEDDWVAKYWKPLYFILNKRCGNASLAEDLCQDTFEIVINKSRNGEIRKPEAIGAFIRQTGVNLMIAHFRKENRRGTDGVGEDIEKIPDDSNDPSKDFVLKQELEWIIQLIKEMKVKRDREILEAHYFKAEGKSSICKLLKITAEHYDRVLYRARTRLKQLRDFKKGGDKDKDKGDGSVSDE